MKTLNTYINETLVCSHSEHINEWKTSADNVSSIKTQYFIYELKTNKRIKIFDGDWAQFKDYKDKVYINGEQIKINKTGLTQNEYEPGIYKVEIKDINNVTNCQYMFFNCTNLVEVPLFDTHKVTTMKNMFTYCENIKSVPKFNTKNVENMYLMFYKCYNLSEETKKEWSKVYDFENECKKI